MISGILLWLPEFADTSTLALKSAQRKEIKPSNIIFFILNPIRHKWQ
jgi:hypothetical protein